MFAMGREVGNWLNTSRAPKVGVEFGLGFVSPTKS